VFNLISRKRVIAEDNTGVMEEICKFLNESVVTFDAALADKELVSKLQSVSEMGISDFYSLKFLLANSGLDILVYKVAELEPNAEEVPAGMLEYNVIDDLEVTGSFVKSASKIVVSDEASDLYEVYKRIIEAYDFFSGDLCSSYSNPLTTNLDLIKQTEQAIGVAPSSITTYINSVLEYLGKNLIVIQN
jgi:hypothetical protein